MCLVVGWYQSVVVAGRADWSESRGQRGFHQDHMVGTLTIQFTRLSYWVRLSGATLLDANIINGNKLSVAHQWVHGVMPMPLQVAVNVGTAGHVWIGNHVGYTANFMDTTLDGGSFSWTDAQPQNHDTIAVRSAFDDRQLDHCAGRDYRLIACFSGATAGAYVKGHVINTHTWTHLGAPGSERRLAGGAQMVDLGTFAITPGGVANTGVEFALTVRSAVAGSVVSIKLAV